MEVRRLFNAYLDEFNKITILLPKNYFNGHSSHFSLIRNEEDVELYIEKTIDIGHYIKYLCLVPTFLELGVLYYIKDEYGNQSDLQSGAIVRTARFDTLYYYDRNDLGLTYSKSQSIFKCWAPTATSVSLLLKNKKEKVIPMKRKQKGIYEVSVSGDLEGYLYHYLIKTNNREKSVIDIYGVASTANAEFSTVINPEKLIQVKKMEKTCGNPVDTIIYEVHIRDFSIDKHSHIKQRGKYLGFIEKKRHTDSGIPTGFDYLRYLGVTHLQILPFFDYGGVDELDVDKSYNWGYNPVQYNTPEGSYSLNPSNSYERINELRQLINECHEYDIGVIMDVVYNHVYDLNTFPFEAMVPGYFYRYDSHGMPTNGSGCGNDLATERLMVRKFIIDSVKYWAREYGVDGFRFDLMGLMDIDTMNIIRRELDEINPQILVYGEGWNLNTALPDTLKASKMGHMYEFITNDGQVRY